VLRIFYFTFFIGISTAISRKRCKIAGKLVLITDRKSQVVDELSIGTKIGDHERRNGFILRFFTEFGSFRGALRKSGWQSHNYRQFTITMSSKKRLQTAEGPRDVHGINIL